MTAINKRLNETPAISDINISDLLALFSLSGDVLGHITIQRAINLFQTAPNKGIFDPVVDINALKTINNSDANNYINFGLINVGTRGPFYLDRNSTLDSDDLNVVAPTTGVGRWIAVSPVQEESDVTYDPDKVYDNTGSLNTYAVYILKYWKYINATATDEAERVVALGSGQGIPKENVYWTEVSKTEFSSIVGGDLSGTLPNPNVVRVQGLSIQGGTPINGDVWRWNSVNSRFELGSAASASVEEWKTPTPASGEVIIDLASVKQSPYIKYSYGAGPLLWDLENVPVSGWSIITVEVTLLAATHEITFPSNFKEKGVAKANLILDSGIGAVETIVVIRNGVNYEVFYAGTGGGGTWGSITGTLADQTDLQAELDAKAATSYVDSAIEGLKWKEPVRAASTANVTLSGAQTIDGIALIAGDRVLVKDQTTGSGNGIYIVAAGAWSRSNDANTSAEVTGATVNVKEGTVNADKDFVLSTDSITLGSTSLIFVEKGGNVPNGSTTTAGKFEKSTDAETIAGTSTGGSGALLAVGPDNLSAWWTNIKTLVQTWTGIQTFGDIILSTTTASKVLKTNGTKTVVTGTVDMSDLSTITALSVVANATNATGTPQAVAATSAYSIFVRNASNALTWLVGLTTEYLANGAVTLAKMANLAPNKVIANVTGLTTTPQAVDLLDISIALYKGVSPSGSYTMDGTEHAVNVDTAASRVITFAPATSYVPYKEFIIKDITGSAGANNITFAASGADTIDDSTAISTNKGKAKFYSDGVSKIYRSS